MRLKVSLQRRPPAWPRGACAGALRRAGADPAARPRADDGV